MKTTRIYLLLAVFVILTVPHFALSDETVPVDVGNFKRAETDMYFGTTVKDGGFGQFSHRREMAAIDQQTVVRMNRDTLYSSAVFDLEASSVTITLPDAGKRFRSMMVVNEDHYIVEVVYKPGQYTYTKDRVGTRYVLMALRTLADPNNAEDLKAVHALQDAVVVDQKSKGTWESPKWDPVSQKRMREALDILGNGNISAGIAFGTKKEVDPIYHLIGTAIGWGGNPPKDATYTGAIPKDNDGKTVHTLTVKDVPVNGFWSISVYNAKGYFEKNNLGIYSLNNLTAQPNPDGSFTVQFGGCDGKVANCIPITKGWNYTVRMYQPRKEILDGTWKFPEAQPVK